MATIEEKEKVVEVLKEGPYKYYKVVVRRTTVRETEYLVKHKVSDGKFDGYATPSYELSYGDCPENWTDLNDEPYADEYDPEIESVEECDENGNTI